jgi:monothiol glutaredoxin
MTNEEIRDFIKQAIDEQHVMLFMKGTPESPRCGFSARVVAMLDDLGADYAAMDILPDPRIREELAELFIDRQLVGGCDIAIEMYESGELAEALGMNGNTGNGGAAAPEPAPQEQRPIQIGE